MSKPNNGFLLLRESTDEVEILNENTSQGKVMYLEGPFISCESKNRNGRIYPKAMMEQVVDQYQNDYITERRAFGEFIHPDYPIPNPKKAAIKIESLEWRGNLVYGRAKVLEKMDEGKILKNLIEEGFKLGVSTRGMGKLSSDRTMVNSYQMNAIDAVDLPSGRECYFDVVNENAMWFQEGSNWIQRDAVGEIINEKTQAQMATLNEETFLLNLDKAFCKKIYG